MLNLDEIIKHVEYVVCHNNDKALVCMGIKENRQLADWLRELAERRKAQEIVRCGECKHNGTKNCVANTWATIFGFEVKDDFYCGLAKRRIDK